jgi:hypothetical protein
MVRSLLSGSKSQTRRILNPQPNMLNGGKPLNDGRGSYSVEGGWKLIPIATGDRLYIRETFSGDWQFNSLPPAEWGKNSPIWYWADENPDYGDWTKPKPGIHMPRWASRITLIVESVKVERLQDISEEDAIAEGIEPFTDFMPYGHHWKRYRDGGWNSYVDNPIGSYASLWTEINGAGSWEANPWICATSFRVIPQNIDTIREAA